jgi:hypothetical protein
MLWSDGPRHLWTTDTSMCAASVTAGLLLPVETPLDVEADVKITGLN